MAKTVDEGFATFLTWLTPLGTETDAAKAHRASVEACLKVNYAMQRFFRSGSFGNGTSIAHYSDVDYFAEIPAINLKQNSNVSLNSMCGTLDQRFPRTGVKVNAPAIAIPFGQTNSEAHEIVPAHRIGQTTSGYAIYDIPDRVGGWMRSCPDGHNDYVRRVDNAHSNKVKPLIRFLKAWKYYNSVPISSFYLEMYTTMYAAKESAIIYPIDIWRVLAELQDKGLPAIQDPLGVAGSITACNSLAEALTTRVKIQEGHRLAVSAWDYNDKGYVKTAFQQWDKFYNNMFPSYS